MNLNLQWEYMVDFCIMRPNERLCEVGRVTKILCAGVHDSISLCKLPSSHRLNLNS